MSGNAKLFSMNLLIKSAFATSGLLLPKLLLALIASTLAFGLSGCSQNSLGGYEGEANLTFNYDSIRDTSISGADIVFVEMMIPHHSQAVVLGELAEKYGEDTRLKGLAAEIAATQKVEIDLMEGWLEAANAVEKNQTHSEMRGMLTEAQFKELESLRGRDFDVYWLELMIEHHSGAVEMVNILRFSDTVNVLAFADHMKKVQSAEIAYMEALLSELKG